MACSHHAIHAREQCMWVPVAYADSGQGPAPVLYRCVYELDMLCTPPGPVCDAASRGDL